jgi:hypothetical protein
MNLKDFKATGSKYLDLGINQNVQFIAATGVDNPEVGSPYLQITLCKQGSDPSTDSRSFRLTFKDCDIQTGTLTKGGMYSMQKVTHLIDQGAGNEVMKTAEFNSLEELASIMNRVLNGVTYEEFKFAGEEYRNQNNEVKIKTLIPLAPFCNGPKTVKKRELKFDENNTYDLKRLVAQPQETISSVL